MAEVWDYLENKYILGGIGATIAGGYITNVTPPPAKKYVGLIPAVGILTTIYGVYKVSKKEEERPGPPPKELEVQVYIPEAYIGVYDQDRIEPTHFTLSLTYRELSNNKLSGGVHIHFEDTHFLGTDPRNYEVKQVWVNGTEISQGIDSINWATGRESDVNWCEVYGVNDLDEIEFRIWSGWVPPAKINLSYRAWTGGNILYDCAEKGAQGIVDRFRYPPKGMCTGFCQCPTGLQCNVIKCTSAKKELKIF